MYKQSYRKLGLVWGSTLREGVLLRSLRREIRAIALIIGAITAFSCTAAPLLVDHYIFDACESSAHGPDFLGDLADVISGRVHKLDMYVSPGVLLTRMNHLPCRDRCCARLMLVDVLNCYLPTAQIPCRAIVGHPTVLVGLEDPHSRDSASRLQILLEGEPGRVLFWVLLPRLRCGQEHYMSCLHQSSPRGSVRHHPASSAQHNQKPSKGDQENPSQRLPESRASSGSRQL